MTDIMPREKALEYGISSLTSKELMALIVKSGYEEKNVFDLVDDLLALANGFNNILSLSYEELITIKGIKKAKALEIMAILEISKRLSKIDRISEVELNNPDKVVEWLRFNIAFSQQEEFLAVYLNGKGNIIKHEIMYRGSKHSSIVGIDEILRKAIILKSTAIVIAHNHPSDNVTPSKNDIDLTSKLKDSCLMVDIPLLDHLIIGKSSYFSFKKHGLI